MAHGDAREGKWRGNWRMEYVASTLHTTSELGVSSITTADAHTSAASSQLSWSPRLFKWTCPFRWKTKSGFCTCAITFQTQSTNIASMRHVIWEWKHKLWTLYIAWHSTLATVPTFHTTLQQQLRFICGHYNVDIINDHTFTINMTVY
jgi:hypothetical protein